MAEKCKNCGGSIAIRNPTGKCDHLYYPENLTPAQRKRAGVETREDREKELIRLKKVAIKCLQFAYRKHCLQDPSIGWNELDQEIFTALCEIMGDDAFQKWVEKVKK